MGSFLKTELYTTTIVCTKYKIRRDLHMYFENIIIDRKTMKGMIHFYCLKRYVH